MSDVNERVEHERVEHERVEHERVEHETIETGGDDFEGHQLGSDMFEPKVEEDFEGHRLETKAEPKWEEKVEE